MYVTLYNSGYNDLFVAASVFIGPACLASAFDIGTKARLLLRRIRERQISAADKQSMNTTARSKRTAGNQHQASKRHVALHMLAERFVLQHDQHQYEEERNKNDRDRYNAYCIMLAIVSQARNSLSYPSGSLLRFMKQAPCTCQCNRRLMRCRISRLGS